MNREVEKLYNILAEILGESKSGYYDGEFQYEFPCPHCVEKYGQQEVRKYNLSISLQKQKMNCWKCSSEGDDMHGSIVKLIRMYGNEELLSEYKAVIRSIRESDLYKLNFSSNDFNIDTSVITKEELKLPESFKYFNRKKKNHTTALKYLLNRGLTWDIIEKYKIGYTEKEEGDNKKYSYRVIIPSYDALGELNYWVGRDYLPNNDRYNRTKYSNPKAEKKEIIFNEEKIQWDADITLVEGAFDHIVVPNSVPLLGKALDTDYKLYWELVTKFNGNHINIWLDNDAEISARGIYSLLNHGKLHDKIRIIETTDKDPSEIFENYGYRGIVDCLRSAKKIPEQELIV